MQSSPSPPHDLRPSDGQQAEVPGGLAHHWRGRGRVLRRGGRHPRRHCRVARERALNPRKSGKKAPLVQHAPSSGQNWNNCPQLLLPRAKRRLYVLTKIFMSRSPSFRCNFTSALNLLSDQLCDQLCDQLKEKLPRSAVESAAVDELLDRPRIVS